MNRLVPHRQRCQPWRRGATWAGRAAAVRGGLLGLELDPASSATPRASSPAKKQRRARAEEGGMCTTAWGSRSSPAVAGIGDGCGYGCAGTESCCGSDKSSCRYGFSRIGSRRPASTEETTPAFRRRLARTLC